MKIHYAPIAGRQLADILAYLRERSPRGTRNVGSAIRRTVSLLAATPFAGREGRVAGTREFPVKGYPYLIVYVVDGERDELLIASIVHMARGARYRDDP